NILKQGLLGAGVGAVSAGASGGKAGKGALIGAGTNVIGGALLDTLTGSSQPQPQQQQVVYVQQPQYAQSYPAQQQQGGYYQTEPQPVYVQQAPAYQPPQEDPNKKILKQGLLGAGVGAISASASGGSAGKGALIGAGTNVIGGALLDTLTGSSQPQRPAQPQVVYVQQAPQGQYQQYPSQTSGQNQGYASQGNAATSQLKKKIIRKYDSDGHVVSEEEVWE
ncbi:MAG: hypothetical protein COT00_02400, partial [Candidatus Omnitrophica bacterium CG07_land_8_20_14_0_80_50_8]